MLQRGQDAYIALLQQVRRVSNNNSVEEKELRLMQVQEEGGKIDTGRSFGRRISGSEERLPVI